MTDENHQKSCNKFTVSMLPLKSIHEYSNIERDYSNLFNLHRRMSIFPLLKKSVAVEELMSCSTDPLKESLCLVAKEYKDLVKTIDKTIGEIFKNGTLNIQYVLINELLHLGLFEKHGALVDEIYLQIMRRINGDKQSEILWKLMICVTDTFPPSKGMSPYILKWFNEFNFSGTSPSLDLAIKRCHCNFNVFWISGPRAYKTAIEDVKFWVDESINKVPIFGNELEEIYANASLLEDLDGIKVPKILIKLTEMIRELNGFKKEGIFRISGDLQQVYKLKILLSKAPYDSDKIDVKSFKDASVPCSTMKLWLRVLKSPLIPDDLYTQFLICRKNPQKLTFLLEEQLPKPNYFVIFYICSFLIELAAKEHQEYTKMSLDNFSMIFAPCFMRCPLTSSALEVLRRSSQEREVLREIFNHFISIKKK